MLKRRQKNITDRALRYRANRLMPRHERRCIFCGRKNGIKLEVGHVNGREEDSEPDNLSWTCYSCNTIAGNTLRSANLGRLTKQFNPTKRGGAANIGEWVQAIGAIVPHKGEKYAGYNYGLTSEMSVPAAVAMIRATPHHKRVEFASQLRRKNPLFGPGGVFGSRETVYDVQKHIKAEKRAAERAEREREREQERAIRAEYRALKRAAAKDKLEQLKAKRRGESGAVESAVIPTEAKIQAAFRKGARSLAEAVEMAGGSLGTLNPAWRKRVKNIVPPLGLYDLASLSQAERTIRRAAGIRNPRAGAVEMSEKFHGRPVKEFKEFEESVHYHRHLAELGTLEKLQIYRASDGRLVTVDKFGGALLCANEAGTQLYVVGGDQELPLPTFEVKKPYHDFEDLGEIWKIHYYTTKDHLGDEGGEATYYHEFGEEDEKEGLEPRRPRLMYSTRDNRILFSGGGYTVLPEGITN